MVTQSSLSPEGIREILPICILKKIYYFPGLAATGTRSIASATKDRLSLHVYREVLRPSGPTFRITFP